MIGVCCAPAFLPSFLHLCVARGAQVAFIGPGSARLIAHNLASDNNGARSRLTLPYDASLHSASAFPR